MRVRTFTSIAALVLLCAASAPALAEKGKRLAPGTIDPAAVEAAPATPATEPAPSTESTPTTESTPAAESEPKKDADAAPKKKARTARRHPHYGRYYYRHYGFFQPFPRLWFNPYWPRYHAAWSRHHTVRYRHHRWRYSGFPFLYFRW